MTHVNVSYKINGVLYLYNSMLPTTAVHYEVILKLHRKPEISEYICTAVEQSCEHSFFFKKDTVFSILSEMTY